MITKSEFLLFAKSRTLPEAGSTSILKAINKATDKTVKRIYCTYIDSCPSGRLYTKNYSFQSIPEIAREVIHSDKGYTFILADYNSFELRILSALAHDTYFKDCGDKGLDLYRKVVSDMKGISYDSVTDNETIIHNNILELR